MSRYTELGLRTFDLGSLETFISHRDVLTIHNSFAPIDCPLILACFSHCLGIRRRHVTISEHAGSHQTPPRRTPPSQLPPSPTYYHNGPKATWNSSIKRKRRASSPTATAIKSQTTEQSSAESMSGNHVLGIGLLGIKWAGCKRMCRS